MHTFDNTTEDTRHCVNTGQRREQLEGVKAAGYGGTGTAWSS